MTGAIAMHNDHIGEFAAFRTEWIIRGRNFGDGQAEVTATRFNRYIGSQDLGVLPRAKRGESQNTQQNQLDAAKRAKQQVRLLGVRQSVLTK